MKKEPEYRTLELDKIEVRSEDDKPKIRGHAAVFNKWSENLGGFIETIKPGTFSRSIKVADIRALFNHNPSHILGRNKANTLVLAEDKEGLAFEIDPPDTSYAHDLIVSIERGDITQMSFAFNPHGKKGDEWDYSDPDLAKRTLLDVDLFDISPVTYPAFPQTDVKVRSILAEVGIDFDALTVALESAERGSLSQEEVAELSATIEKIRSYLPAEGEPGSQEVTGDSAHLEMLRKKLVLIAKT